VDKEEREITKRIKTLLKEHGYTLTEFADKLGTSKQNLLAKLKSPSYPTLEEIAKGLEIPMWKLFASEKEVRDDMAMKITCPHCNNIIKIKTSNHGKEGDRVQDIRLVVSKD
jgi:transcriptional regulator with XRE-family HTH domain